MKISKEFPAKSISYGSSRKAEAIKYIVIHYTGNKTDKAINNAKYYANGNTRSAGAHFFVDEGDVIYQSISPLRVAWAVGGSKYANTKGASLYKVCTNANSVSIEMCSTNGKIAEKTLKNVSTLVKMLMEEYNVPAKNVIRHYDVTGKPCPGYKGWIDNDVTEWNKLKKMVSTVEKKAYSGKFPEVPPTLVKGNTGTQVNRLQNFLNWYGGYALSVDSKFGNATERAVKDFQVKENVPLTNGKFGVKSLEAAKLVKK